MRTFSIYVKTLSTSTLMQMKKAELVEYIRMCEKNMADAYATLDQQATNFKKLLDEQGRPTGKWERPSQHGLPSKANGVICSYCWSWADNDYNFCPNCGAYMKVGESND